MSQATTYLISIAISEYPNLSMGDLPNAVNDSKLIANELTTNYHVVLYEDKFLHNQNATIEQINLSFEKINLLNEEYSLLVFFNGHGRLYGKNEDLYLLLSQSQEADEYRNTWYSFYELLRTINNLKAKHIAFFINCCYSGNLLISQYPHTKTKRGNSRFLFASGNIGQKVPDADIEYPDNSPFAHHIWQILHTQNKAKIGMKDIVCSMGSVFEKKDYGSKPIEYLFPGHGGGDFYLHSKLIQEDDEPVSWKTTEQTHTVTAYAAYLRRFENEAQRELAEKRISELEQELEDWKENSKSIQRLLDTFIKQHSLGFKPQLVQQAKAIRLQLYEKLQELTIEERAEQAWKDIEKSKDPQDFRDFDTEFPNSKYKLFVKEAIVILDEKLRDEANWKEAQRGKTPINKRKGYSDYSRQHKNGRWAYEATCRIRELDLFISVCEVANNDLKIKKLDDFLYQIPKGICKQQATNLLNKCKLEKRLLETQQLLTEAIQQNDDEKVREMNDYLAGLNSKERASDIVIEMEQRANSFIEQHAGGRRKEHDEMIQLQSIPASYAYIQKYKHVQDKLWNEAMNDFETKDKIAFEVAEEAKTIDAYKAYLNEFEPHEGAYCEQAKKQIDEMELFNGLHTQKDFEAYLELYPDGILRQEARQQIDRFNYEAQKTMDYEAFMAQSTIETAKIYRATYPEQDDKHLTVANIGEKLKKEQEAKALFQAIQGETDHSKSQFVLCKTYLETFPTCVNAADVRKIRDNLLREKEADAFNDARKINTLEGWQLYQSDDSFPKPKDNQAYADKQINKFINEMAEQKAFDKVYHEDSEEACLEYLAVYGKNGRFLKEVTQMLWNKQHGVADEEKQKASEAEKSNQKMDDLQHAITSGLEKLVVHQKEAATQAAEQRDKQTDKLFGAFNQLNDNQSVTTRQIEKLTNAVSDLMDNQQTTTKDAEHNKQQQSTDIIEGLNRLAEMQNRIAKEAEQNSRQQSDGMLIGLKSLAEIQKAIADNSESNHQKQSNDVLMGLKNLSEMQHTIADKAERNTQQQSTDMMAGLQKLADMQNTMTDKMQQNSQQQSTNLLAGLEKLAEKQNAMTDKLQQNAQQQSTDIILSLNRLAEMQNMIAKEAEKNSRQQSNGMLMGLKSLAEMQKAIADNSESNHQKQSNDMLIGLKHLSEMQHTIADKTEKNTQQQSTDMLAGLQKLAEMQNTMTDKMQQNSQQQSTNLLAGLEKLAETQNTMTDKMQQNSQQQSTNLLAGLEKLAEIQNRIAKEAKQNIQQQSTDTLTGLQKLAEMQLSLATALKEQSNAQTATLTAGFNKMDTTLKEALTPKKQSNYSLIIWVIVIIVIALISLCWIKYPEPFFQKPNAYYPK
jgi:hypothetical protein